MKRIILLCLCSVFSIALLCSCGKDNEVSDVDLNTLVSAVDTALSNTALNTVEDSYIKGSLKVDTALCSQYSVKLDTMGTGVDEYGIFKALDQSTADTIKQQLQDYLKMRQDSWMDEYMPEEKPKIDNASINSQGLYIMYTILSDDAKTSAVSAFNEALK